MKTLTGEELKKYKAKIKEDEKREKNAAKAKKGKIDGTKIATRVVAFILCLLMLLSVCGTLLFYIFA